MNEIGNKIKTLRKAMGYKQEDICNEILSRTELSKIENGRRTPSIYQIKYISEILNTSADYLLDVNTKKNDDKSSTDNKSNIEKLFGSKQYHKITLSFEKGNIFTADNISNLFFVGSAYYKTEFYVESEKLLIKFVKEYEGLNYDVQREYCENYAEALRDLFYIENCSKDKNIEMSKLYKAKNELEKHERVNSKIYLEILYHIGFVYFCIDRFSDAVFLYKYSNSDSTAVCCLDYANMYRFMGQYDKALTVIDNVDKECLKKNKFDKIFLLYKSFIYFNMTDYQAVMKLLKHIKITDLNCYTKKSSYYFLKGHIAYMNNQCDSAIKYLKKSERYLNINKFNYDLKLLYSDLYSITKDDKYKKLYEIYSGNHSDCKKNIVESLDIEKYKMEKRI